MAGASRLVQSELLGSGHRTVPCSSQTTNLRSWKSKFNRLAGPALVAEAPPSSPRLLGTEESRDLISLVLGNHRTPFTFPHVTSPSPNFPPVYTCFQPGGSSHVHSIHHPSLLSIPEPRAISPPGNKSPRNPNTFPLCSHLSELLPGSATYLSSAWCVVPKLQWW